jgi:hypothetical protein
VIALPKGWIPLTIGGKLTALQVARIASIELFDGTDGERRSVVRFGGPDESGWIVDEPPHSLFAAIDASADNRYSALIDL